MFRHFIFWLASLCVIPGLHAQVTPEVLKASTLNRGIYKNYGEFLNNAPSIKDDFLVLSRSRESKIAHGDATYYLVLPDSAIRARDAKRFWGACDGSDVYVNELSFTGKFTFRKMHGLGRYCFLMASEPSAGGAMIPLVATAAPAAALTAGVATAVGGAISFGEMFFVLNINNGKFFPLNPKTVETILEKEPKLLQEYQTTRRHGREEVMVDFIKRYNETHLDEADTELWFGRDVALYRKTKREFEETIQVTVNDSLQFELGLNSVHQFQIDGESVKICVGEECKTIPLFRTGTTYILTEKKKSTVFPTFLSVPLDEGKKDVDRIVQLK